MFTVHIQVPAGTSKYQLILRSTGNVLNLVRLFCSGSTVSFARTFGRVDLHSLARSREAKFKFSSTAAGAFESSNLQLLFQTRIDLEQTSVTKCGGHAPSHRIRLHIVTPPEHCMCLTLCMYLSDGFQSQSHFCRLWHSVSDLPSNMMGHALLLVSFLLLLCDVESHGSMVMPTPRNGEAVCPISYDTTLLHTH